MGSLPRGPAHRALRYRNWYLCRCCGRKLRSHRPVALVPLDRLGALRLSVTETVLIFGVVPLGIVLIITALASIGGSAGPNGRRYRPGRPFEFTPVWFLSAPEQLTESVRGALPQGGQVPALTVGELQSGQAPQGAVVTGGASDRW
jgi:hypothetical protein